MLRRTFDRHSALLPKLSSGEQHFRKAHTPPSSGSPSFSSSSLLHPPPPSSCASSWQPHAARWHPRTSSTTVPAVRTTRTTPLRLPLAAAAKHPRSPHRHTGPTRIVARIQPCLSSARVALLLRRMQPHTLQSLRHPRHLLLLLSELPLRSAGASVKAEKNRCARNCFVCPCCQHTLSVLASDAQNARDLDPTDPVASQGAPPYYLGCSFCRWDSRPIGLVFDKPTGLSFNFSAQRKTHPTCSSSTGSRITSTPTSNTNSSRNRFSSSRIFLRSRSRSSNPPPPLQQPRSQHRPPTLLAPAALHALPLPAMLRQPPSPPPDSSATCHSSQTRAILTPSLPPLARLPSNPTSSRPTALSIHGRPLPTHADLHLRPQQLIMGVVAKREKHRRDYLARIQSAPNQPITSLDDKIASLQQRWSSASIADQPIRAADLRPTRVPLKSKLSRDVPPVVTSSSNPTSRPLPTASKSSSSLSTFSQRFSWHSRRNSPTLIPSASVPQLPPANLPHPRISQKETPFSARRGHSIRTFRSTRPRSLSITATSHDVDVNNLIPDTPTASRSTSPTLSTTPSRPTSTLSDSPLLIAPTSLLHQCPSPEHRTDSSGAALYL